MKINENSFLKFIIACLRTGNKELVEKVFKQNKNHTYKSKKQTLQNLRKTMEE